MKRLSNYLFICLLAITNSIWTQSCPDSINNSPGNSNDTIVATVYDINGDIIQTISCESTGNSGQVDCDLDSYNFPNGAYISLELTNGNNSTECYYDMDGQFIDNLPIELSHFTPIYENNYNKIEWATYSERNNDYFIIEYSSDGINWSEIHKEHGQGNSTQLTEYSFIDRNFEKNQVNYYRLTQYDYNGDYETFDIKSVDNFTKELVKIIDLMGNEVDSNFDLSGIFIYIYTDGTKEKVYH